MRQTDARDEHCAVCRPTAPWKKHAETCCAEHREIFEVAETIRKGTATEQWEPQGPEQAKERWRNRAERVRDESGYQRHWLHCIVAQGGRCGDPQKDPTGKGCGRHLLALPAGSVHVDHIVPRKEGGRDNWVNCQALCTDCNIKAGDGSREDSPVREAQRIWEATKSPEVVCQAREQEGLCARCLGWLWSKEPTTEWVIGDDNILVCNRCGKEELIKVEREKKKKEMEREKNRIKQERRKRKNLQHRMFYTTLLLVISYTTFAASTCLILFHFGYIIPSAAIAFAHGLGVLAVDSLFEKASWAKELDSFSLHGGLFITVGLFVIGYIILQRLGADMFNNIWIIFVVAIISIWSTISTFVRLYTTLINSTK